ncbi:MAG: hypothetical protein OET57_19570 [Desulfobacteraceae bacterium]|nr:hypothetical protein [Desulfobacteraceae bacterium]MDH3838949.1 hypothetical protein [Desulfobacteraceae bacterium]
MLYHDHFLNFSYAILIGVFGSVILVFFFSGWMTINTVGKSLPFIIAFNVALTGYNLINRVKRSLKFKRTVGVISGIIVVIITVLFLNTMFFYFTDGFLVYWVDFLVLIGIGSVFSWLGAVLAIRYFHLE